MKKIDRISRRQSLREALRVWRKSKRKQKIGTYLYDLKAKKNVLWIPCKAFAKLVGRSYESILDLARVGWLPSKSFGDGNSLLTLLPKYGALRKFRQLQSEGLIYSC